MKSKSEKEHFAFKADRETQADIKALLAALRKRGSVSTSAAIRAGLKFAADHVRAGKEL